MPLSTRESAYNHPALQPPEDDSEWSTLPQRKPRHREQPKNLITTSAKFLLPIHFRGPSPATEPDEKERIGKRPRITLYRPPSRTVNVDLAGLESRYALVRSAMRKVRTGPRYRPPSLFQCA
jgi:hypothetical protein